MKGDWARLLGWGAAAVASYRVSDRLYSKAVRTAASAFRLRRPK